MPPAESGKNNTEIAGMRACHIRDGAAMVQFLAWLDNEVANGRLHNEAELADRLEAFRRQDPTLVDLSFDTISAAGTNALCATTTTKISLSRVSFLWIACI